MKVLFFHVPSLGVYNSIEPVLLELVARGHTVIHYNFEGFSRYVTNTAIAFKAYRDYRGFDPSALSSGMNVYELGLVLLETAEHTADFVESELVREAPDVVLHSKFMAAPKQIARKHGVPAVCLTTGFVFHPRVVVDSERRGTSSVNMSNVASLLTFKRRAKRFYQKYVDGSSDPNDVFVNEEPLNLVLGLEMFQPMGEHLGSSYKFIGPTVRSKTSRSRTSSSTCRSDRRSSTTSRSFKSASRRCRTSEERPSCH